MGSGTVSSFEFKWRVIKLHRLDRVLGSITVSWFESRKSSVNAVRLGRLPCDDGGVGSRGSGCAHRVGGGGEGSRAGH